MDNSANGGLCSAMDTQIFNMKLSVTGTSAYILVTALMTDGVKPSLAALRDRWNADPETLEQAINELENYNILENYPGPTGETVYVATPASMWRMPADV